jgi:ornithine carbamoyltransferase
MTPRHFIDIWKLQAEDLRGILDQARQMKVARTGWPRGKRDTDAPLSDQSLAMLFEKNSTRTRFSFDMAMRQLGGQTLIASASEMQLGRGESVEDTSRVLSRYVDAVMIRANRHEDIEAFAGVASVPVINGLSDRSHPCQIMADLLTLEEQGLTLKGARLAWVGDGNNVCASFMHAADRFGFSLAVGTPVDYRPAQRDLDIAAHQGGQVELFDTAMSAVEGADVVIADTFVSMGDADADRRLSDLGPFCVTEQLMDRAQPGAVFLHCLPAHRGEEVTAEVIDGPQSLVFEEAENRLHAQKAILRWCLNR